VHGVCGEEYGMCIVTCGFYFKYESCKEIEYNMAQYEISRGKYKPLYEQIEDQVKHNIISGKYKEGHQLPPELQLSEELGVSRNTVRQALVNLAKDGYIERSKGRGSFVTRKAGVALKSSSKRSSVAQDNILILQPRFRIEHILHPFYCEVISTIETIFGAENYGLVYSTVNSDTQLDELIKRTNAKGIIMAGVSDREVAANLVKYGLPVASVHEVFPGLPVSCISVDNVLGGYLATSYLIKQSHRHIAFILSSSYDKVFIDRHRGYVMALEQHRIDYCPELVYIGEPYEREAYETTNQLIASGAEFDSIVASSDVVALGVMDALFEHGLQIPDDVSLVGYDDLNVSHLTSPRLTTIRQPAIEVGQKTAERMLGLLYGEGDVAEHLLVEPALVERESCSLSRTGLTTVG
jgi:DNA-binding LacI/PurR family transcriptional regulator